MLNLRSVPPLALVRQFPQFGIARRTRGRGSAPTTEHAG
jgi:hypothetical protein